MSRLGGRFRLERELGTGGMARVFLGTDEVLGRPVAVKVLKAGFDDSEMAERFRREGRTAARLSHPNVVQVYDAGEGELDGREVSYIVMEYVPGGDLKQLMNERGLLPEGELSRIGADVAAGLAHAHERGIVHRDVKPHNILLDEAGRAKLTDFGIARALDVTQVTQVTQTGLYLGTALYSSPEQLQGHRVTPKSDVYSLGATLYQAATGEPPFTGGPLTVASQHAGTDPTPPREIGAPVGEGLEAVILGCLAKDPADRPDARKVRERLEEVGRDVAGSAGNGTGVPATPPPRPQTAATRRRSAPAATRGRSGRRRRRRGILTVSAVLALAAALVLVGAIQDPALLREVGLRGPTWIEPNQQQARSGNGGNQDRRDAARQPPPQTVPQQTSPQKTVPRRTTPQETVPQRTTPEPTRPEPGGGLTADAAAQTVEQVYESADAGDYGTSYALLSSDFRRSTVGSEANWAATFDTVESITFVEGPTATVSGDTATVTGTTIARKTDGTERNVGTWTLVNEGGEWKLDGLSLQTQEV